MTTLDLYPNTTVEAPTERLPHTPRHIPSAPTAPGRTLPGGRYLLVRCGDETEIVPLIDDVTHLGRGLTADIRLDDHLVSRRHAVIITTGSRTRIIDDRSANGVRLNGRAVQDADLYDGDVIVLGRSILRYLDR
jgi:hypothetical protein